MTHVTVKQTVDAPLNIVWDTWDDFGNIADFNPVVKKSYLLDGSTKSGLGAKRHCDMKDGKNFVREEMVGYTRHKQMVVDIFEGSIPVKDASGTIDFNKIGPNKTEVTMTLEFTPKMGLIGKIMQPVMKKQFTSMVGKLLAGNAVFAETRLVAA